MKFQKTIILTAEALDKLEKGTLTLQKGQWVQIPSLTKRSRFVGVTKSKSLWIVHKQSYFRQQCKTISNFQ